MARFIVKHIHSAATCPAQNPQRGAMLLNHLSRPNVARFGIRIHGEAVVKGEHTLYLIVEADDSGKVTEFVAPFSTAGSVDVYPASTCSGVVAAGSCDAPLPTHDLGPSLNPEDACQEAIDSGLVVHRAHPLNCETSIPALIGGVVMPNARFYLRNHFHIPHLTAESYRLTIGGLVANPLSLGIHELRGMRSESRVVTLECAGNGRTLFDPPIEGEKWDYGAVSTAEWTGVPLSEVLKLAVLKDNARSVVFQGADGGKVEGRSDSVNYERSLKLEDRHFDEALLAYAMNGEPPSIAHGYPLRLIMPNWYAVASVKWLTHIEVVANDFDGFFQTDRYRYRWNRGGKELTEPVTLQKVRALITEPGAFEELPRGRLAIRGVAWSGNSGIAQVSVSVGDGEWRPARLLGESRPGSWRWWELIADFNHPGPSSVRARAADLARNIQPERAEWNALGYGNNSIQRVPIRII